MSILAGCSRVDEGDYEAITSHLQSKYGKAFELKEVAKGTKYLGGSVETEAAVFPTEDEELIFNVWIDEEEGRFADNYLELKWEKEAEELVRDKIKTIFGNDARYQFLFSVKDDILHQKAINNQQQDLSFTLREHNDSLAPFIQIVDIGSKKEFTEQLNRLYELISFLHANHLQHTRISLETYSPTSKKDLEANPKKYVELGDTDRVRYKQDGTISFSVLLRSSDTESIKSKETLFRIFKRND